MRVSVRAGARYLWLPDTEGNSIATPNTAALNVTGDLALTTLVAKGESHDGPALTPHQD
jgi:hypothetical protein